MVLSGAFFGDEVAAERQTRNPRPRYTPGADLLEVSRAANRDTIRPFRGKPGRAGGAARDETVATLDWRD